MTSNGGSTDLPTALVNLGGKHDTKLLWLLAEDFPYLIRAGKVIRRRRIGYTVSLLLLDSQPYFPQAGQPHNLGYSLYRRHLDLLLNPSC